MCVWKGRGDFWQQPGVRGQAMLEQELPADPGVVLFQSSCQMLSRWSLPCRWDRNIGHCSVCRSARKRCLLTCCLYLPVMGLSFFLWIILVLHNKNSRTVPPQKNCLKFQLLKGFYLLVANYNLFLPCNSVSTLS